MRIQTEFAAPLCAGNLAYLEGFLEHAEVLLGVEMQEPVEVIVASMDRITPPGCRTEGALGCYLPRRHRIAVRDLDFALPHELIHALTASYGRPGVFFNEAIANAVTPSPLKFAGASPTSYIGGRSPEIHAATSGHFMRWILDTWGADQWREFHATSGSYGDFTAAYGVSLEAAEDDYLNSAPAVYAPTYQPAYPLLAGNPADGWYERLDFDCESSDTFGGESGIVVLRHLEIEEEGLYAVWSSGFAALQIRVTEDLWELGEVGLYAVNPPSTLSPHGGAVGIAPGTWRHLRLNRGAYALWSGIVYDEGMVSADQESVMVVIRPVNAPEGTVPGQ